MKTQKKIFSAILAMVCVMQSVMVYAEDSQYAIDEPTSKPGDAPATTPSGGLVVINPKNPDYWMQISGVVKLDQRIAFSGKRASDSGAKENSKRNLGASPSGASIREMSLEFSGGLGKSNIDYLAELEYDADDQKINASEINLALSKFQSNIPNLVVALGYLPSAFGAEMMSSGKRLGFMEKSVASRGLATGKGLGVGANSWSDNYSISAALLQNAPGKKEKDSAGKDVVRGSRIGASSRATYVVLKDADTTAQVGLSLHHQQHSDAGISFSSIPEAMTPNMVPLLSTNSGQDSATLIAAKHRTSAAVDFIGIYGPWSTMAEYIHTTVKRGKNATTGLLQGENLQFHGAHFNLSYVLCGGVRVMKKLNGVLGNIKFDNNQQGAWELSGRLSHLNLNNKDIRGGKGTGYTVALGYFANENIKVLSEYNIMKMKRAFSDNTLTRKNYNSVGIRLQCEF